jgi:hypothetical protein
MRDARDAEDALLLQSGDHPALIAAYHEVVVQRCLIAVRSEAGYDVAQNVFERLLKELARGKRYRVPYRVVVHKVVDWTVKEHSWDVRPTCLFPTAGISPTKPTHTGRSRTTMRSMICSPISPKAPAACSS